MPRSPQRPIECTEASSARSECIVASQVPPGSKATPCTRLLLLLAHSLRRAAGWRAPKTAPESQPHRQKRHVLSRRRVDSARIAAADVMRATASALGERISRDTRPLPLSHLLTDVNTHCACTGLALALRRIYKVDAPIPGNTAHKTGVPVPIYIYISPVTTRRQRHSARS